MKTKTLVTLSVIALGALFATPAHAGWGVSVSIGVPVYAAPVYAPPVAYYPPVVYCPPVRYCPPPRPVCAPPVVYVPACHSSHGHYASPARHGGRYAHR